jgi:hypothetical protein
MIPNLPEKSKPKRREITEQTENDGTHGNLKIFREFRHFPVVP